MANNNDFDLDQFWRELIDKSKWATKNAGSLSGSYKKLNILKGKKEEINNPPDGQQLANIKNKLLAYYLIIFLFSIFIFIFSILLIYISSSCKSNIGFIKNRCFKTVDYCDKYYAENSSWINGSCSCPEGYIKQDKNCIKNSNNCLDSGHAFSASDGSCKCSSGYVMAEGGCISYYDYCRLRNAKYMELPIPNSDKPLCSCPTTSYWDKEKESCSNCQQLIDSGVYNPSCNHSSSTIMTSTKALKNN